MSGRAIRIGRFCVLGAWLSGAGLALMLTAGGPVRADNAAQGPASTAPSPFKICKAQTYALCAVASCFVFNGLSYCKCDLKWGDSISLPFDFDHGQDICSVDAEGTQNGFTVSTYSLPESVVAPDGGKALYSCPAKTSDGAYAQCDGGVCFAASQGMSFPGLGPLKKGQIICSCPITVADPATAKVGYQIAGPYPCRTSFFRYCKSATANTNTGSKIYVGSPTGTARLLTRKLYGGVPPLNQCRLPGSASPPQ